MRTNQLKTPSLLETWRQVLLFLIFHKEIAPQYHSQMVLLHGCSKKSLFLYVKNFPLTDEALMLLFQKADKGFLQKFLSHYFWDFPQNGEQILLDRFGLDFLIDNLKWTLSTKTELNLLQLENAELIGKYTNQCTFTPEAELEFFKKPFPDLQKAYAEKNDLCDKTENFLLETKNFELLSIHLIKFGLKDDVVETFYRNAPDDLVLTYLSEVSSYPSDKEFKTLLSRSITDFIKQIVLRFDDINYRHLKMLLKSKRSNLVRAYLEQKAEQKSSLSNTVWRSLFDVPDFEVPLQFALKHFDLPEEFEVRLFKAQLLDLLEYYTQNHAFQNWGFPMLLALGKRDLLLNYLTFHQLSWGDECLLIEQNDKELIDCYLKKHSFSSYAQAIRIKTAGFSNALAIVKTLDKFDDFILDALFYHNEEELWEVYLSHCNYHFREDLLIKFFERANVDVIINYLSYYLIDGKLSLKLANNKLEDELYFTLYKRQNEKITGFLLQHSSLISIRDCWFIRYASYDFIKQFLENLFDKNIELSAEAEKELICRKYEDLLQLYFAHYSLYQENLVFLAHLLSPELMRDYLLSHREDKDLIQKLLS